MKAILGLWRGITTAATVYMLYKQLETVKKAKDTLYQDLGPEQRLIYEQIFGKPNQVLSPPLPPPVASTRPDQISQIAQAKAGV